MIEQESHDIALPAVPYPVVDKQFEDIKDLIRQVRAVAAELTIVKYDQVKLAKAEEAQKSYPPNLCPPIFVEIDLGWYLKIEAIRDQTCALVRNFLVTWHSGDKEWASQQIKLLQEAIYVVDQILNQANMRLNIDWSPILKKK